MLSAMNKHQRRFAALLLLLITAWLLWSGIYTPLLLGLGALSCVLSLYLAHRIRFFNDAFSLHVILRLPRYWGWLLLEIAKSSFDVARIILNPHLPISPTVVEFEAISNESVGQTILGNAITLSPGTVTLDVHNGRLQVHCLTREVADGLLSGVINSRTAELIED